MRLDEIVQTQVTSRQHPGDPGQLKNRGQNNPNNAPLGDGVHAIVVKNKNINHEVTKIATPISRRNETDGYHKYITALIRDGLMGENPYFPRVYNLHSYSGNSRDAFTAKMEKLEPLRGISNREWESILSKIVGDVSVITDEAVSSGKFRGKMFDALYELLKEPRIGRYKIVDDHFMAAAIYILNLETEKTSVDYTIHNLMVRRTPQGLQLVITDPLF